MPLAGEVGGGDLGQVLDIEQGQLQRAVLDELADLRGAQRGDPVQLRGADVLTQARAVSMPRSPTSTTRAIPNRSLILATWAATVLGSPVLPANTSCNRDAVLAGQQPVDDLEPTRTPSVGCPTAPSGHVRPSTRRTRRRRDQGAAGQVPGGEGVLDARLPGGQRVHRRIQVIFIAAAEAEDLAQGAGRVSFRSRGDRQLGSGAITCATTIATTRSPCHNGSGSISSLQPQGPQRAEHGGDVAVRQAAGDLTIPSSPAGGRPFSARDSASTLASGHDDKFARAVS